MEFKYITFVATAKLFYSFSHFYVSYTKKKGARYLTNMFFKIKGGGKFEKKL